MSPSQREIYVELLKGAFLMQGRRPDGTDRWKLYRGNMEPVRWLTGPDWKGIQDFLRWENPKEPIAKVLDLRIVRRMHGKSLYKSLYKKHRGKKQDHPGRCADGTTEIAG